MGGIVGDYAYLYGNKKSPQGSWKTIQKRILVPRLRTLMQS